MHLLESLMLRQKTPALVLSIGSVALLLSLAFFGYSAISNTTYAFFVFAGLSFLFLIGATFLIAAHLNPLPKDVVLEVGGMEWLDKQKERLLICTRRGELWVLDNVYADSPQLPGAKIKTKNEKGKTIERDPTSSEVVGFKRMLFGMHEPLGMVVNPRKINEA